MISFTDIKQSGIADFSSSVFWQFYFYGHWKCVFLEEGKLKLMTYKQLHIMYCQNKHVWILRKTTKYLISLYVYSHETVIYIIPQNSYISIPKKHSCMYVCMRMQIYCNSVDLFHQPKMSIRPN